MNNVDRRTLAVPLSPDDGNLDCNKCFCSCFCFCFCYLPQINTVYITTNDVDRQTCVALLSTDRNKFSCLITTVFCFDLFPSDARSFKQATSQHRTVCFRLIVTRPRPNIILVCFHISLVCTYPPSKQHIDECISSLLGNRPPDNSAHKLSRLILSTRSRPKKRSLVEPNHKELDEEKEHDDKQHSGYVGKTSKHGHDFSLFCYYYFYYYYYFYFPFYIIKKYPSYALSLIHI